MFDSLVLCCYDCCINRFRLYLESSYVLASRCNQRFLLFRALVFVRLTHPCRVCTAQTSREKRKKRTFRGELVKILPTISRVTRNNGLTCTCSPCCRRWRRRPSGAAARPAARLLLPSPSAESASVAQSPRSAAAATTVLTAAQSSPASAATLVTTATATVMPAPLLREAWIPTLGFRFSMSAGAGALGWTRSALRTQSSHRLRSFVRPFRWANGSRTDEKGCSEREMAAGGGEFPRP